jgi:hypothetical protein
LTHFPIHLCIMPGISFVHTYGGTPYTEHGSATGVLFSLNKISPPMRVRSTEVLRIPSTDQPLGSYLA